MTIENCDVVGCSAYGLYIERDAGQTVPRPVVVDGFVATECLIGVGYRRGADAPPGVGEVVMNDVTVSRTITPDGDGYLVAGAGVGLFLDCCPLSPPLHAGLTVSGCAYGIVVVGEDAAITAPMNVQVRRCGVALLVDGGGVAISDWTNEFNHQAVEIIAGLNAVTLAGCRFSSRDDAAGVSASGPFEATNCEFASQTGDALLLAGPAGEPVDATITDCVVGAAGLNGLGVSADAAAGGSIAFTRCVVSGAGADGFRVENGSTTTLVDCEAAACGRDGFGVVRGDAALHGCLASDVGGCGVRLSDCDSVFVDRCTVDRFGTNAAGDGFSCVRCAGVTLDRCVASSGAFDGLGIDDGGAGPVPDGSMNVVADNFLARQVGRGVHVGAGGRLTLRHATLDAVRTGLELDGGEATATNCVIVGGETGVRRAAGTLLTTHVLLHGPVPAVGVAPSPSDLLADPRFAPPPRGTTALLRARRPSTQGRT